MYSAYHELVLANAGSVRDNDKNAQHQFGSGWPGSFDWADAAGQSSGGRGLVHVPPVAASGRAIPRSPGLSLEPFAVAGAASV